MQCKIKYINSLCKLEPKNTKETEIIVNKQFLFSVSVFWSLNPPLTLLNLHSYPPLINIILCMLLSCYDGIMVTSRDGSLLMSDQSQASMVSVLTNHRPAETDRPAPAVTSCWPEHGSVLSCRLTFEQSRRELYQHHGEHQDKDCQTAGGSQQEAEVKKQQQPG